MNRYFLHELNKIRISEQARLLNHALGLLQKTDTSKFQADIQLLKQELAILNGKKIPDENQLIVEENYDKLVKVLENYVDKYAKIEKALQEIQGIVSEREKFWGFKLFLLIADLFFRIFITRKKRTSFARLSPFANELKKHLADLNVQFSNAFPGPYHIRPLEPFRFLRHQARLHEGMISIIIPSYNSAATIEVSILSFSLQSYKQLDIIVVDDYSKDNTPAVQKATDSGTSGEHVQKIGYLTYIYKRDLFEELGLFWENRFGSYAEFVERVLFQRAGIKIPKGMYAGSFLNRIKSVDRLFRRIDNVLMISLLQGEKNLSQKYKDKQWLAFQEKYRNKFAGTFDYHYPEMNS